jgi:hypothetical protein
MESLRFHEKHLPTLSRLHHIVSRPVHWTAHLGMIAFIVALMFFAGYHVVALANLRNAVAVREATMRMEAPYGSVSEPSLLGKTVVCEPSILRWYYGSEPLCESGLDDSEDGS